MFEANTFGKVNVIKRALTPNSNIAILGLNPIAAKLYAGPSYLQQDGQRIVGFIHIDPVQNNSNSSEFPNILGEMSNIKDIIKRYNIGRVVLAIDPTDRQKLHDVIQKCEKEQIAYELIPESYDVDYEPSLSDVITDEYTPDKFRFQRLFDLLISLVLFILFLPSWIVIAIAIKLESPGNVLYTQERVGKDGKIFRIYKFRSMYADAEKRNGPQLATRNDPRITKVGNIIRKTRVDELPQLVNVIRGDMSLVGPRPERPYFVEKYSLEIPSYLERLKVKPGLTGYAQVEGGYDETLEDVKEKLGYDLYYIEHQNSFLFYWKILFKTLWVVLSARGQ
jgi:exopolysaccharide biosynthesis polyprenyl glycosylphosphotransferase